MYPFLSLDIQRYIEEANKGITGHIELKKKLKEIFMGVILIFCN